MKLIVRDTKTQTRKLSALERAKRQLAASKQADAPADPPGEYFTEEHRCSTTGKDFTVRWHRALAGEQFRVYAITTHSNAGNTENDEPSAADSRAREYEVSDFDTQGRICPHCENANDVVYCGCGKTLCSGGCYYQGGLRHCRVQGCCEITFGGVRTHKHGETQALEACGLGRRIQQERKRFKPNPKQKRITHDSKPLLPRQN